MSAKTQTQEQPAVLAHPVIGGNLQPASVPSASTETVIHETNQFSEVAHIVAEEIRGAYAGRWNAWIKLAKECHNHDDVALARKALFTECDKLGMARAHQEASEWLVFATVYVVDEAKATHYLSKDFKQPVLLKDGSYKKDALGQKVMVNPSQTEIVKALRSERDVMAKQQPDKLPPSVYEPRKPGSGGGQEKLTTKQVETVEAYLDKASPDQLASLSLRLVTALAKQPDPRGHLMALANICNEEVQKWKEANSDK